MDRYHNIDEQLDHLNIEDEENEGFIFKDDIEEESDKYDICLIGRFLKLEKINTKAMKIRMTNIWKPTMGINIKEIDHRIYLFQFYHQEDMLWSENRSLFV